MNSESTRYFLYLSEIIGSTCFILAVFQILDSLQINIHPTLHRLTYTQIFTLSLNISSFAFVSLLLWVLLNLKNYKVVLSSLSGLILYPFGEPELAVSLSAIVSVIVYLSIEKEPHFFIRGILTNFAILEFIALIDYGVLRPLGVNLNIRQLTFLEYQVSSLMALLAPPLILYLLFSWASKAIIQWGYEYNFKAPSQLKSQNGKKVSMIILAISIILGVISSFYPFSEAINPYGLDPGVDIKKYLRITELVVDDPSQIFEFGLGLRPVMFIFLRFLVNVVNLEPYSAVKYSSTIVIVLLTVTSYFLSREITDEVTASLSSFFTVTGYQVTVGMYAFFVTNILALSFTFLCLMFLIRASKNHKILELVGAVFFGSLILFTHPWTFFQYFGSIFICLVYLLTSVRRLVDHLFEVKLLGVFVVCMVFVEIVKDLVLNQNAGGSVAETLFTGVDHMGDFWANSIFGFRYLHGGFLSNLVLIILVTLGVMYFSKNFEALLMNSLLFCTSLVYLFGDNSIKARLIFNLPVGLFASIGFMLLMTRPNTRKVRVELATYIILFSTVTLFRCIANLV